MAFIESARALWNGNMPFELDSISLVQSVDRSFMSENVFSVYIFWLEKYHADGTQPDITNI